MATDKNFLELIDQIYDAALEPNHWPSVLEKICGTLNATQAYMAHRDFDFAQHDMLASHNIDPSAFVDYGQYYIEKDVWAQYGSDKPTGSVFTGPTILPDEEFLKLEFYNDFLKKRDIRYLCGMITQQSDNAFSTLGLYRSKRQEDFQSDDIDTANLIVPHLSRSVQMYSKFARLENLSSGLLGALELTPDAVFLLDGNCRIEHMNVSASDLLERRDGFSGDQRILRTHDEAANNNLQAIVSNIAVSQSSDYPSAGEHLIVRRLDGRRPFQLLIAPLYQGR